MRVLRHQIEVFGLRIGGDSAVTPRPAKNSYGFFNRSRSECPGKLSYLCRKQIYQHILHRYHGIRRNRLQNTARDEGHLRTRRLAAPGRSVRDERRLVRTQNLRDVLQQARRRRPAERGCRPTPSRSTSSRANTTAAGTPTSAHGACNPSRPNRAAPMPDMPPIPEEPSYASSPGRSGRPAVLKRADTIHSGGRSDFRPPLLYTHKHGKTYRHRHTPPARNGTAGSTRPRWARLRRVRSPGIQPRRHRRIPPLCRTGSPRGTAPQRVDAIVGRFPAGKARRDHRPDAGRSHLCLLFVEKACHRQGIARALFSALRDHCRTAPDTPRITVNSSPYAVGAYRRLGFRTTGDERTVDGIRFTPMEYLFI